MRSYQEKLEANPRAVGRPFDYQDLLLEPIADDPTSAKSSYSGWEAHHIEHEQFYLGGIVWFLNNVGISINRIADFREEAASRIVTLTNDGKINWRDARDCQTEERKFWGEIARQQFNKVKKKKGPPKSLYFSKLMVALLACELAVEKTLERNGKLRNIIDPIIEKPEDIYKVMRIIPACWNINNFNESRLEEMISEHPELLQKLTQACGREDGQSQFIVDLAKGHPVQWRLPTRCSHAEFETVATHKQSQAFECGKVASIALQYVLLAHLYQITHSQLSFIGKRDCQLHQLLIITENRRQMSV